MKLFSAVQLAVRVLLSLVGVLVALAVAVCAGPAGCGRPGERSLVAPTDTIRASALSRILNRPAVPVVLASTTGFHLMQVRRLVDADTYEVEPAGGGGRARLRLVGVDAPEVDQPFGRQATSLLSPLLLRRWCWVRVAGVDQYGRNLAVVRLRVGAFASPRTVALDSLLVARGWAWAHAPSGQTPAWAGQQQAAVTAALGLWKCGINGVVRPGIWRAYNRNDKASAWWGCPW